MSKRVQPEQLLLDLRPAACVRSDGTITCPRYAAGLHPGIKDWIHRCYSRGYAHGAQLAEDGGRFRDGRLGMCSTAWADRVLESLESAGWIVRDREPSPSASQRFGGVGGRTPGAVPNASNAYAQEFGYRPNYSSAGLLDYVHGR